MNSTKIIVLILSSNLLLFSCKNDSTKSSEIVSLIKMHKPEEAYTYINSHAFYSLPNQVRLIYLAEIYHQLGIFDSAAKIVANLDSSVQHDLYAMECRASLFQQYGKRDLALNDFKYLISNGPLNSEVLIALADLERSMNQYPEAEKHYLEAIKIDKQIGYYYNNISFLYGDMKEYSIQKAYLDTAIDIEPKNPVYYFNRAICYSNLKDNSEALEDLNICISLDPGNSSAYLNQAIIRINNQLYDVNPCKLLEKAMALNNEEAVNIYNEYCK